MKIIFEQLVGGARSTRAKFSGSTVEIVKPVDGFAGLVGAWIVDAGGEGGTFGAYGDELILVPDPKPGDVFCCPSCGAEDSWREWSQDWYSQSVSVVVGSDGRPEIDEYYGDGEHGDGGGEGAYLTCRACDNDVELSEEGHADAELDAQALDQIAKYLRTPVWGSGADFLEWAATLVVATGRDIVNGVDLEGEAQGTAKEG